MLKKLAVLVLIFLLVNSCSESKDKGLVIVCDKVTEAAKKTKLIEYSWLKVLEVLNKPLNPGELRYSKKRLSLFYFRSIVEIDWSQYLDYFGHEDYRLDINLKKDFVMDEDKLKKSDTIIFYPNMVESVHVGPYRYRLLFILKHPVKKEDSKNLEKLGYDVYVECNGRAPENYDTKVEPIKLIKIN